MNKTGRTFPGGNKPAAAAAAATQEGGVFRSKLRAGTAGRLHTARLRAQTAIFAFSEYLLKPLGVWAGRRRRSHWRRSRWDGRDDERTVRTVGVGETR